MTQGEKDLQAHLECINKDTKYIYLSLRPQVGNSTIVPAPLNRACVEANGEHLKFNDISESFYGSMVEKYDKRCQK